MDSSTIDSARLKQALVTPDHATAYRSNPRTSLTSLGVAAALLCTAAPAAAQWKKIASGVELLQQTRSGPVRVYAARIDLCAPGLRLRATAPGEGPRTVSSFGALVGATVAINGDWPARDGTLPLPATYPRGLSVGNGKHFKGTIDPSYYGFVAFGFNRAYHSHMSKAEGKPKSWMREVVSGQPTLVWQGKALSNTAAHCAYRHPRTAVGMDKANKRFYMVVVDGRSSASRGMTCNEMAALMRSLGAYSALLQDGGGSSTFYVKGRGVLNHPADGKQRSLVNHWAVVASGSGPPYSCVSREIPKPSQGGVKRHVPNPTIFAAWKFGWRDVIPVSESYLKKFKTGKPLPSKPQLVRGSGGAIFLRDASGYKRHVPNPYAMYAWRFAGRTVARLSDAKIKAMTSGPKLTTTPVLVKGSGPAIYLLDRALPARPPTSNTDAAGARSADAGRAPTDAARPAIEGGGSSGGDGGAAASPAGGGSDDGDGYSARGGQSAGGCALSGGARGSAGGAPAVIALALLLVVVLRRHRIRCVRRSSTRL